MKKAALIISAICEFIAILLLVYAMPTTACAGIAIGVTVLGMLPASPSLATRFLVGAARLVGVSALVFAVGVLVSLPVAATAGGLFFASVVLADIFEGVE